MIQIAGSPFSATEMLADLPASSIEHQVLQTMADSTSTYRFDTKEQLVFELDMRREIVAAAKELNASGLNFSVFQKSKVNTEYWERTNNGGFLLKRGAKPSEAIADIFTNGSAYGTECATAMVIVYYRALMKLMPEETFNRLFPSIYLMNWHRLDPLLREVGTPVPVADILLGDRAYFRNPEVHPDVSELQGENVIVLPDGLYYGHGLGIAKADWIIRVLNANRIEDATQSAYFIEDSAARPNFKRLAAASQSSRSAAVRASVPAPTVPAPTVPTPTVSTAPEPAVPIVTVPAPAVPVVAAVPVPPTIPSPPVAPVVAPPAVPVSVPSVPPLEEPTPPATRNEGPLRWRPFPDPLPRR